MVLTIKFRLQRKLDFLLCVLKAYLWKHLPLPFAGAPYRLRKKMKCAFLMLHIAFAVKEIPSAEC